MPYDITLVLCRKCMRPPGYVKSEVPVQNDCERDPVLYGGSSREEGQHPKWLMVFLADHQWGWKALCAGSGCFSFGTTPYGQLLQYGQFLFCGHDHPFPDFVGIAKASDAIGFAIESTDRLARRGDRLIESGRLSRSPTPACA